jgi:hypothetical protein
MFHSPFVDGPGTGSRRPSEVFAIITEVLLVMMLMLWKVRLLRKVVLSSLNCIYATGQPVNELT